VTATSGSDVPVLGSVLRVLMLDLVLRELVEGAVL
jgi:hypothetical protein